MSQFTEKDIETLHWNTDVTIKNIESFKMSVTNLSDSEKHCLILDITEVTYVNSAALGAIVDAVLRARYEQKELVVAGVKPSVWEIFSIVKFETFIKLFPHYHEAVDFFCTN